jgi:hypothetical protein
MLSCKMRFDAHISECIPQSKGIATQINFCTHSSHIWYKIGFVWSTQCTSKGQFWGYQKILFKQKPQADMNHQPGGVTITNTWWL